MISVWNNTALRWARKRQEQKIREYRVRFAQYSIERRVGWENRGQMQWTKHNDPIMAR
jgi:hypothetical protein